MEDSAFSLKSLVLKPQDSSWAAELFTQQNQWWCPITLPIISTPTSTASTLWVATLLLVSPQEQEKAKFKELFLLNCTLTFCNQYTSATLSLLIAMKTQSFISKPLHLNGQSSRTAETSLALACSTLCTNLWKPNSLIQRANSQSILLDKISKSSQTTLDWLLTLSHARMLKTGTATCATEKTLEF